MEHISTFGIYVADTTQHLMDINHLKPALKMLKGSSSALKNKMPASLVYRSSVLFNISNNFAQLMNRESNVEGSLQYLEDAIEIANDPRVLNRTELPLAETYLNLSNALSFLGRYKESL
jgi:tetratricopeptide (TPR) repeat protein